jgi:tRNA threonylcarbamoyladenosine biosynthesis protein TsaB
MILAFECSTRRGQVALCEGEAVVAERAWEDPSARHAELWTALKSLLAETSMNWAALDAIAVGRGPGSFSGLRAAITAARVLATPDLHPVIAVSSGEALALDWLAARPGAGHAVIVAGDARRGSIWYGVFHARNATVRQDGDWALAPCTDFPGRIPPHAELVTSDGERLARALGAPKGTFLHEAFPSAAAVARLAWRRMQSGSPGEPVEPLYLHPPVQT